MINCVFCSIAAEEAPSYNVAESDRAVAFLDINPAADGHTLVIPKTHADDIWDLDPEDGRAVWTLAQEVAAHLSERLEPDGMTIFQANRKSGWQHVFHFHRTRSDAQNLVTAVDDVTFARNEYVFAFREKNFSGFTRLVGKAEEFQIDRGRGRRWRGTSVHGRRRISLRMRDWLGNLFCLCPENIASCALILCVFAGPQPFITQCRVERALDGCISLAVNRTHSGPRGVGCDCKRRFCGGSAIRTGEEAHDGQQQGQHHQGNGSDGLVTVFGSNLHLTRSTSNRFPASIVAGLRRPARHPIPHC